MPDRVVLDARAVLVFLGEEPGWAEVEEILRRGEPSMTLANLGEVARILERSFGAPAADQVWATLRVESRPGGVPVCWIDVDDTLVRRAADIEARGGLSCADAFAAGAASILGRPVLTGDPEFRVAEELGIGVRWLGRRAQHPSLGAHPTGASSVCSSSLGASDRFPRRSSSGCGSDFRNPVERLEAHSTLPNLMGTCA